MSPYNKTVIVISHKRIDIWYVLLERVLKLFHNYIVNIVPLISKWSSLTNQNNKTFI